MFLFCLPREEDLRYLPGSHHHGYLAKRMMGFHRDDTGGNGVGGGSTPFLVTLRETFKRVPQLKHAPTPPPLFPARCRSFSQRFKLDDTARSLHKPCHYTFLLLVLFLLTPVIA